MTQTLASLLEESIEVSTAQLRAARRLDVPRLRATTRRRQELIAAIDALDTDALQRAADPMVRGLIETQRELDERLGRVLGAAASVFNDIAPGARSGGYTAAGRLRGGAE